MSANEVSRGTEQNFAAAYKVACGKYRDPQPGGILRKQKAGDKKSEGYGDDDQGFAAFTGFIPVVMIAAASALDSATMVVIMAVSVLVVVSVIVSASAVVIVVVIMLMLAIAIVLVIVLMLATAIVIMFMLETAAVLMFLVLMFMFVYSFIVFHVSNPPKQLNRRSSDCIIVEQPFNCQEVFQLFFETTEVFFL